MKVPKMYKSSDRYNAGVDVIYDDDSKLQYAPFIHATTESGDNGADDGGDEEGEDSMLIKYDYDNERFDKTWQEVKDASLAGKTVILVIDDSNSGDDPYTAYSLYYLTQMRVNVDITTGEVENYTAVFMGAYEKQTISEEPVVTVEHTYATITKADTTTDYLVFDFAD